MELDAVQRPGPGECWNCGQRGHDRRDCTRPPLCYRCGRTGHIGRDCRGQAQGGGRPARRNQRPPQVNHIDDQDANDAGQESDFEQDR